LFRHEKLFFLNAAGCAARRFRIERRDFTITGRQTFPRPESGLLFGRVSGEAIRRPPVTALLSFIVSPISASCVQSPGDSGDYCLFLSGFFK
jgi:hypothetical protein